MRELLSRLTGDDALRCLQNGHTSCVVLDICKVHLMMVHGNKMHCKTHRTVIVSSIKYFNGP